MENIEYKAENAKCNKKFTLYTLSSIFFLGALIYVFHLFGLVTPANEVYVRFGAFGLFVASFALLGLQKTKKHRFSWDDIYKNNTLIIISLSVVLVSSFLKLEIGFYAIGIFVGASLLHFLYTRKFYPPNKLFYFVFLYALLLFFGTIGTKPGFHFPDRTLAFYVLPLSLCFFRLSKKTLLEIAEVFFKTGIVFLAICVLYWWYNFLHLDANFIEWITSKTNHPAEMIGWEQQVRKHNTNHFSAYFFVSSWSYYFHPSFIAFVLFFGLIIGFYLYHKRNLMPTITKFELILYIALCFFVLLLLQSRIGVVGFVFILAVTGLYYLKLKTKRFKIGLAIYLLLGCTSFFVLNDTASEFVNDDVRNNYRRIAVSYIQDNFWWGSGYFQQQIVLEQQAETMKDILSYSIFPHINHPIHYVHNQFLGDMVQFGIWGLLVLLAMLVAIAYYAIKNRSYLLQMMLLITVLFMMIEEPLYTQVGIIRFTVFLVFFVAISKAKQNQI